MPHYTPTDYDAYDEAYEDAYFEGPVRSKPKPKKRLESTLPGVVVRALGHHYEVETDAGIRICRVLGRLLQERSRDTTLVTVGDRVDIVPEGKKKGLIDSVMERDSVLSRQRPGDRKSTRLNSSHIPLSRMPSSA